LPNDPFTAFIVLCGWGVRKPVLQQPIRSFHPFIAHWVECAGGGMTVSSTQGGGGYGFAASMVPGKTMACVQLALEVDPMGRVARAEAQRSVEAVGRGALHAPRVVVVPPGLGDGALGPMRPMSSRGRAGAGVPPGGGSRPTLRASSARRSERDVAAPAQPFDTARMFSSGALRFGAMREDAEAQITGERYDFWATPRGDGEVAVGTAEGGTGPSPMRGKRVVSPTRAPPGGVPAGYGGSPYPGAPGALDLHASLAQKWAAPPSPSSAHKSLAPAHKALVMAEAERVSRLTMRESIGGGFLRRRLQDAQTRRPATAAPSLGSRARSPAYSQAPGQADARAKTSYPRSAASAGAERRVVPGAGGGATLRGGSTLRKRKPKSVKKKRERGEVASQLGSGRQLGTGRMVTGRLARPLGVREAELREMEDEAGMYRPIVASIFSRLHELEVNAVSPRRVVMTSRDGKGEVRGEYHVVPAASRLQRRPTSSPASSQHPHSHSPPHSTLRMEGHSPTRVRPGSLSTVAGNHQRVVLKNYQKPMTGEYALFNQMYGVREEMAAVKIQAHARGMQDRRRVVEMRGSASGGIVHAKGLGTRDYGQKAPEKPHVQAKAPVARAHASTLAPGVESRGMKNAQTDKGLASLFNGLEGRDAAATRIQAHERGRQARRHALEVQQAGVRPVQQPVHQQPVEHGHSRDNYGAGGEAAATTIQAHARGMSARMQVAEMKKAGARIN